MLLLQRVNRIQKIGVGQNRAIHPVQDMRPFMREATHGLKTVFEGRDFSFQQRVIINEIGGDDSVRSQPTLAKVIELYRGQMIRAGASAKEAIDQNDVIEALLAGFQVNSSIVYRDIHP